MSADWRMVKVRYSYELEVRVPGDWTNKDIEFHRNQSSWCAVNAAAEIDSYAEKMGCECPFFKCEYLGEVQS